MSILLMIFFAYKMRSHASQADLTTQPRRILSSCFHHISAGIVGMDHQIQFHLGLEVNPRASCVPVEHPTICVASSAQLFFLNT